MRSTWIAVLGVVLWAAAAGATTVDHRWSGDTYGIRVYAIENSPDNGYLLSTFYVVNEGKWEIVRDTVNDAIVFPSGSHSSLADADIDVVFRPYEELKLTLPARYVAEGDSIRVYVLWGDESTPAATFTVEEGGPEPDASAAPLGSSPFFSFVPLAIPLEVDVEYKAGGAQGTISNPGTVIFRGTLKVTASLAYYRGWAGESVTRFLDHTIGRILLAPDAALRLTVSPGTGSDAVYVVAFPDLTERATGTARTATVPPPTERAIAAFRDMIYNIWTKLVDSEPETDYIDLGFGSPGVHLYFPIAPYFPPPR